MAVFIHPGKIKGKVVVPSSKSLSHRALLAALLSDEDTKIYNLSICDDVIATMNIMEFLGKTVIDKGDYHLVTKCKCKEGTLNANESGSTLRFIIPILSYFNKEFCITGSKKLLSRPMGIYQDIYNKQKLVFELNENYIKVNGKLSNGVYEVPGDVSSQFITGLMYLLPLLDGDSRLIIKEPFESKSYVDLTIDVLDKFNVKIESLSNNEYYIKGNQKYKSSDYMVLGDYSQMAFWAVLGTINNDIIIDGMEEESLQGDKEIVNILKSNAGNIKYENNFYYVYKSDVKSLNIDLGMIPDLGPVLGVLGACSEGESIIYNCGRLKYKESDRLEAIKEELLKMNVDVRVISDKLVIKKCDNVKNIEMIDSHNDHRIFMALAVLGTISSNGVRINDEKCINKSYPTFLKHLEGLGIKVDYE